MQKKTIHFITFTLLVMLLGCMLLLSACGDSSDDPVVGTWEMSKVSALGQEMSVKQFLKNTNTTETPKITFNGDNTVDADMMGTQGKGEWERKDGAYIVTDDTSAELSFELKDDTLSVEQGGATLEFEKQEQN